MKIRRLLARITPVASSVPALIPDPENQSTRITQFNPFRGDDTLQLTLTYFSDKFSRTFFILFGLLSIILLIQAGLRYIAAQGNPDQIKKARQSIINIILAIILLVCAYLVVRILLGVAGVFVPAGTS